MAVPSGTSTEVVVTSLTGAETRGGVENFNTRQPAFFLHQRRGERGLRISFDEVKTVAFLQGPASGRAIEDTDPAARKVTVRFLDDSLLTGLTQHSEGPRRGLFLVPEGMPGVERLYAPISAIREVVSVQRLGEILTAESIATPEMVASALRKQEELRNEPLGQILVKRRAITDESLRQVLSEQQERRGVRIGEILLEQGFITALELDRALAQQRRQRYRKLGELMVEMGYVSHKMVGIALAIQYNVPFISLTAHPLKPELRTLIPSVFALQWQVLPLELDAGILTVVVADPADTVYKSELIRTTGLAVTEVVATPQELSRAILELYGSETAAS